MYKTVKVMLQEKFYLGIDMGKGSFVVYYPKELGEKQFREFNNDADGRRKFIDFLKVLPYAVTSFHLTMEATGSYSMPLCYELCAEGFTVYLVNPRGVKKYAQARLEIQKTDYRDARIIADYGEKMELRPFSPSSDTIVEIKQMLTVLRHLKDRLTAARNLAGNLVFFPVKGQGAGGHLQRDIEHLNSEIESLEEEIDTLARSSFNEIYGLLLSVKGIGPACASAILAATNAFENFDNARQFAKFIGVTPTRQQSGTSLNRNKGINRTGNPQLRALLYFAAIAAKRCNSDCKAMYERLIQNSKKPKQALMAVINKLLKQVFAVVKSKKDFVNGYQRT